jgi:ubiquinone/menaquinone biosynthesis C-methylase UbiE
MKYADVRFRLIYTCSTLNYAYDIRRVVSEMLRVLKRPGYIILSDAASRQRGVDPMGRTDPMSADSFVGCFYDAKFSVLFHDDGRTPYTGQFRIWPSVGLRID